MGVLDMIRLRGDGVANSTCPTLQFAERRFGNRSISKLTEERRLVYEDEQSRLMRLNEAEHTVAGRGGNATGCAEWEDTDACVTCEAVIGERVAHGQPLTAELNWFTGGDGGLRTGDSAASTGT